jgi:hypothetical protein
MDLCPKCQTILLVKGGDYQTVNDNTPDKPTEIYYTQELYCNNPGCENHNKTVDTIKHKLK